MFVTMAKPSYSLAHVTGFEAHVSSTVLTSKLQSIIMTVENSLDAVIHVDIKGR